MPNILNIDQSVVKKLKSVKNDNDLFFRVFVTGGGCSGFQYGFEFQENEDDDDTIIDLGQGMKILVDPISYQYIAGSSLFYEKSLMGEHFTVNNPNAKNTCGCGSSFEI